MAQTLAKKLEQTELAEKKREASASQSKQLARTPELPLQKEQSHLSRSPVREIGESQDERDLHLGKKEGNQSESMRRKE